MSSKEPHRGLPPDSPSDVRALPARPNLEFERKQAKTLLKELHHGDPEALARVRATQLLRVATADELEDAPGVRSAMGIQEALFG